VALGLAPLAREGRLAVSLRLAEVAPAAPAIVEALPWLLALAGLLFAVGCIKLVDGFVRALFGTISGAVGWIPWAGKVVKAPIHKIEQKVTNFLGRAEEGLDSYIGVCFHNLAHIARTLVHEIERGAHLSWEIAKFLAAHPTAGEVKALIHALTHPIATFQHIEHRLIEEERNRLHAIEQSVAHGVYPRIRAGEHAVEDVLAPDIAALRHRTRAIEHRLDRLWKWVRAHEKIVVTAAFTGAVAVALSRLGGRWIRCKNWRRIGKHVCGLPTSLIEDLLALTLGFELIVDPEEIARVALDVESAFEGVFEQIAS